MGCSHSMFIHFRKVWGKKNPPRDKWVRDSKFKFLSKSSSGSKKILPPNFNSVSRRIEDNILGRIDKSGSTSHRTTESKLNIYDEIHHQQASPLHGGPVPSHELLGTSYDLLESWHRKGTINKGIGFYSIYESKEDSEEDLGEFIAFPLQTEVKQPVEESREISNRRKKINMHCAESGDASWVKYV